MFFRKTLSKLHNQICLQQIQIDQLSWELQRQQQQIKLLKENQTLARSSRLSGWERIGTAEENSSVTATATIGGVR